MDEVDETAAWAEEERWWKGGADAMAAALDSDAVMVFAPPVGILTGLSILDTLEGAPRWTEVEMTERVALRPTADIVVLAYRAEGRRGEAEPYVAYCTTTYRSDGERWRLVQHQQTAARRPD